MPSGGEKGSGAFLRAPDPLRYKTVVGLNVARGSASARLPWPNWTPEKVPDTLSASYDELGPELELARSVIEARTGAGLTQDQLAKRMKTTQSVIARLESGRTRPSTKTLAKLAQATGTRLKISFEATGDSA